MRSARFVIGVCGLIGLVELLVPFHGASKMSVYFALAPVQALTLLAVFALPTAMALLALRRPPLLPWQAGVSLAAFALGVVKLRLWEDLGHLGAIGGHGLAWVGAIVVGALASIGALARPAA